MEHQINITSNGNELIVREGQAAKIYEPRKVNLTGNIFAPGEYFEKRRPEISSILDKTHVVVDMEGLSITLCVNDRDEFAHTITGRLEFFKDFLDFGINRKKKYGVQELYSMLRLKRAYFTKREDHALILDQLKKFEANTEIEFKATNDFKGTAALHKIEKCKTNLTYNFTLNIPIYKGIPASTFPVEIEFEPTDGSIICWLLSEDLAEMEVKFRDEIMIKEVEKFKEVVVIKK